MINFDKLPEFRGFTVYDAKTGDPLTDIPNIPEFKTEAVYGDLFLTEEGDLVVDGVCGGEMFSLPKGKYIIQIGTEMYKW